MSEKAKEIVNLKLCVFRSVESVKVVNVKTLQGSESEEIRAYGFSFSGEPILSSAWLKEEDHRISGARCGFVNLNHSFVVGLSPLRGQKKLFGYEAIALQLQRNGCYISSKECEDKIKALIESGVNRVYMYLLSQTYGLGKRDYGLFKNEWLFSGKEPESIDYDRFNALALKKSDWKIYTSRVDRLLRKLILSELHTKEVD